MSRVLVTGGAGFIGTALVRALIDAGHEVRVLDDLSAHPIGWPASLDPRAEAVEGDVRELPAGVLDGIDVVSHQAAVVGLGLDLSDLPRYVSVNELGTAVLLAAMAEAGIGRLVLAGSMVAYGEGTWTCPLDGPVRPGPRVVADLDAGRFDPPCPVCGAPLEHRLVPEDAPLDPRSVYAATKVAQEHLCAAWARVTGATALSLRYHNVYGPQMPRDTPYAGVASLWRSALARGESPRVFEDGRQARDFVHVDDVAAAGVLALAHPDTGGTLASYNVCSGNEITVGEVATALAAAHGRVPVVTGEYRLGDVRHVVASPERAAERLGFRARISPSEGLTAFATEPLRD